MAALRARVHYELALVAGVVVAHGADAFHLGGLDGLADLDALADQGHDGRGDPHLVIQGAVLDLADFAAALAHALEVQALCGVGGEHGGVQAAATSEHVEAGLLHAVQFYLVS